MYTGLYCRADRSGWIGYRFVRKGNVQVALDIRFPTLWDAQRYAEKNKLKLVTVEEFDCQSSLA